MSQDPVKKNYRVMHVTGRLDFGGVEQLLYITAAHNDREKYELSFLAYQTDQGVIADRLRGLGYEVTGLGLSQRLYDLRVIFSLYRAIKRSRPDIVHFYHKTSVLGVIAAKLAGVPTVICNNVDMNWESYGLGTRLFVPIKRFLDSWADQVIASSMVVHDYWNTNGEAHHTVMHQPFDASALAKVNAPEPIGPFRRGDAPVFIAVSRFFQGKGLEYLLEAMPTVLKEFPDSTLRLVGAGPMETELRSLISELQIQDSVELAGFSEEVFSELMAADIYVLASLTEGYSISTIEAMAAGLAVVATPVGIVPELIEQEVSGLIVEPQDSTAIAEALIQLLSDPVNTRLYGNAARERVLNSLSPEVYQAALDDLYQELLPRLTAPQ